MSAPSKPTTSNKERALGSLSLNAKGDAGTKKKKNAMDAEKRSSTSVADNSPHSKVQITALKKKEQRLRDDDDQENIPDTGSSKKRPRGRPSIGLAPQRTIASEAARVSRASAPMPLTRSATDDDDGRQAVSEEGGEASSAAESPLKIYEGLADFLASCKSSSGYYTTSRWFRRERNHFTCELPDAAYPGSKCKFAYLASESKDKPAGEPMRLHLKEVHGFHAVNWKNAKKEGTCEWEGCSAAGKVLKELGPHVVQQHGFKFLCPFYRCLHCYTVGLDGNPRYKRECMETHSSRETMRIHLEVVHGVTIEDLSGKCDPSWDCLTVGRDVDVRARTRGRAGR